MYLKRLEMVGFKSFAEKTELTFPERISAIVGPNGCGKSNVVDAFKWIFGEQSAKGMRGEEMKDVIFNGTQTRKPTGMAEVTVVFDNNDRALNIDYSEVAITRRLFRSGESEYLINKQKCRLRDIKELFLDTGLGTSSYSILEQGKIDVLLQASNLDRRIVFEEAAGISKYRVKKAESLRALQRTEENLARLGDIIDEVEKRMHRVKAQAGKARRYREHFDRLRTLRIECAREDYRASIDERIDLTCRRFFCDRRVLRQEDLLARLRGGFDEHRKVRGKEQEKLDESRGRLGELHKRRERTEERIRQDLRRVEELAAERQAKEEELAATVRSSERLAQELERVRGELERAFAEISQRRGALDERLREEGQLREQLDAARSEAQARREAIVALLKERAQLGNRLAGLSSEVANLAGRRERLSQETQRTRAEIALLDGQSGQLKEELAKLQADLAALDLERGRTHDAVQARGAELASAEERLAELQAILQDRRSRLDVLSSFEERREGLGGGVQALLSAGETCPSAIEIRGLVADLIRVDRRHAAAVEAVLGHHAQSLVVETQEGGLALLGHAMQGTGGGVEVIALDRIGLGPCEAELPQLLAESGVLGLLVDQVDAPAEYSELVERLLSGIILVEDLPTAVALSRNGLRSYRLVTLDGSRVEPWGSLSVAGKEASTGLISRRSEMAELTAEVERISVELQEARVARDGLAGALEALEEGLQRLGQEREAAALRVASTQSAALRGLRDLELAERELRVGESELADIALQEDAIGAEMRAMQAQADGVDGRRQGEEAALQAREEESGLVACAHRAAGEAVTELKVRLAEAEERGEGLRRAIEQLQHSREEEDRRQRGLRGQIDDVVRRRGETSEDLETSRRDLGEIEEEERARVAEVETREASHRELGEVEEAFQTEIDRVWEVAEDLRRERESFNLREQEGTLKRNSLVEKLADEYGLDLSAIVEGPPEPAAAAAAAPAPPWYRAQAETEIQALREKLRNMGNVNLEALDELAELEERFRTMTAQRDDLQKAERDLREIIGEINRTSRELFIQTFELVQKHFNEIFRKCFGGGMAELVLEEGADALDAGIEIVARPPGKKLTSLSLMSGGEKTMTTIALLFAIFRSRPSPFCILDEVDAALDENNVQRFVVLLRDFVQTSQFIIITHNKITMGEADCLFGITMEERGVSKRVAVEFESFRGDAFVAAVDTSVGDAPAGSSAADAVEDVTGT